MLTKEDQAVTFVYAGLFKTEDEWIHPKRTEQTFELIYVVDGDIFMEEEGNQLHLTKGDLCLLRPHLCHQGTRVSAGHTSFYWVHFFSEGTLSAYPRIIKEFSQSYLFKELLHYNNLPNCPEFVKQSVLLHLLCSSVFSAGETRLRLATDVYEWTRINANGSLTVEEIAHQFDYHPEHLSRIIRQEYGIGLKGLLDRFLLAKLKEQLCQTNLFIKEISGQLGFRDASACIKFFQYHEGISPNRYRNLYSHVHMNKK